MRIAFVGKGGAGKTTLSALFAQYIDKKYPVLVIDADLNMHMGPLLGFEKLPYEKHISHPEAVKIIKTHLKGKNERIKEIAHFKKTTPPSKESGFVILHDFSNPVLSEFGARNGNIVFLAVGTYGADEIGSGCYHGNLAILEIVLSHLIDAKGVAVVDMVAGVDAFANTLHAQFDMLVISIEPTKRGVEVFKQYEELAREAGVYGMLFAVGNKIRSQADEEFLQKNISPEKLLGFFPESDYLRRKDQEGGFLEINKLEKENVNLLETIKEKLYSITPDYQARLLKLFELHRKFSAQKLIQSRFGDLTNHIDLTFDMDQFVKNYQDKN